MPNAAARRSRKATPASTPAEQKSNGVNVVSTLTAGDFQVEELGDYEFTRAGAGRKREPSVFDDLVQDWAGQGTRRIPVDGDEAAKDVIKALQKACEYRNRGLEKRTEEMDGQLYVVFRINPEKATRAPRKNKNAADVDTSEEFSEDRVDAAETE